MSGVIDVPNRVPLARRNLLADWRRLVVGALAMGLAIMLILLLDGLWTGITQSASAYEDNVDADLYVAQPNTRNFVGAVSLLPRASVDQIAALPDVQSASPVRTFLAIVSLHDRKVPTAVIGWEPGAQGGPWEIDTGRAPSSDDEVAIGPVMAERHGLRVGDSLELMGRDFRIVGTSSDTFMLSFVFMTHAATDELLRAPDTTSFVLVQTDAPDSVRARLDEEKFAVLTSDDLAANDVTIMTRPFGAPMTVMRGVAFAIGIVVIALTVYSGIVDRRREYGIVKAMGATRRDLTGLAVRQTLLVAAAGLVAGALLFLVGRQVVTSFRPQFTVVLTLDSAARAVAVATVMAVIASVFPAHRLAKLEPAIAYRGG
jgi:putative ABC transport system permease protein